jgi:hypothetical protein
MLSRRHAGTQVQGGAATYQTVHLERGSHACPEDGVCVMELASMLAGEPFTDEPRCVCKIIGRVLRAYDDVVDNRRRQDLYEYASLVVGTSDTDEIEWLRADYCLRWAKARRSESHWLFRLLHWRTPKPDSDPVKVFMPALMPLIRRPSDRRHQQVLALIEVLVDIRSHGGPTRMPVLPREPVTPASVT